MSFQIKFLSETILTFVVIESNFFQNYFFQKIVDFFATFFDRKTREEYTIKKKRKTMKKKTLILPLIPALIFSLASCRSAIDTSKIVLDFGRVHPALSTTVTQVSYKNLKDKMIGKNESFIVAVSDDGCGCWRDFQPIVAELNYKHELNIMHVDKTESGFLTDDFGLNTNTTSIAFFRDGKLARQVLYTADSANYDIFHTYKGLENLVKDNVLFPHVKLVSKDILDSFISQNKEFNLYVGRNGCGDCDTINGTLLRQWNRTTTVQDSLYYFDIEEYRGTADYQNIKDAYGLSQTSVNPVLGYTYTEIYSGQEYVTAGVVPTFQRRKGTEIKDMISILNDAADVTNKKISRSYFTAERVAAMPFLAETGNQYVLQDKTLTEDEAANWRKSEQLKYHTPIFNKFFETYFK